MKVLFFAQSRVATGRDGCVVQVDAPLTQAQFWKLLVEVCPGVAAFQKTARLARRETYLQGDEQLQPDDEIAVIPPVSGG